jgi:two-component system CheB/CheR fusion protein
MTSTFGKGLTVGAGLVVALLIANAGLTLHNVVRLRADAQMVAHTHEVLDTLAELITAIRRAESAELTYLFTGQQHHLEPLEPAVVAANAAIDKLHQLTADNPPQQQRVPELRKAASAMLGRMRHAAAARAEGPDGAQRFFQGADAWQTREAVRAILVPMEQMERDLLREREQTTARAYQAALATGVLTAVIGLAAVLGFITLVRANLRARMEALAIIQQERERFRVTLASIGDGVIVTDDRGRVTFLNAVARALTGWNDDALGRELPEVFRIANEQTGAVVQNPALRALREGTVVGLANHTALTARDGTRRPIDDSAAPIRDEHGTVVGVVLVFRDVTERRRNEAALREADRMKDEFLATLAHELRNPLAPLRNGLHLMKLAANDPARTEAARAMMERQLRQLVRLVDDLLDVSRITRNKLELRRARVELATIIQSAVEAAAPLIESLGHTLSMHLPPGLLVLDADLTRLAQVFGNLLTNAAKYTERGGQIGLTAVREDDHVFVTVTDTGIGIAPEHLHDVFGMFTQVAPAAQRVQGGLGIGLALVARLVEMHGGTVEARSEGPGKGSAFVVRLPLAPVPLSAEVPATASPPAGDSAARYRVAVADDNVDAAQSLATLLTTTGHEVRTAYDGLAAVALAEAYRPDVALLDIGMPGLDGYEVARRIRAQPWGKAMALVALTGWGQDEDKRRAEEAGFDRHVTKPVDPGALGQLLAELRMPRL